MSRRIFDTPFADLLPESIRHDSGIAAAATALDPALRQLVLGVPNLLLFSRLDPSPGHLSPPLQRLTDAAGGLKPLSEAELELLAWQFHVDFREVAKTPAELAVMVRESIPWHRIKGTPASIQQALAMFGITAKIEEHTSGHWATYQMELDSATAQTVAIAYTVAKAMQPVRCRLGRVYNKWDDGRIIIHDVQSLWGKYYWEHETGTPVTMPDGETVIVAFGKREGFYVLCPEPALAFGTEATRAFLVRHLAHWLWDVSRWGDVYPAQARVFPSGHTHTVRTERNATPWSFRQHRTWFEQLVWDDDHSVWDDDNFRWSLGAFPWHGAQVWGDFTWGEAVPAGTRYTGRRVKRLFPLVARPTIHEQHPACVHHRHSLAVRATPPNTWPNIWKGRWDRRRWMSCPVPMLHTQISVNFPPCIYGESVWGNFLWS